jgi:hypothetical protein
VLPCRQFPTLKSAVFWGITRRRVVTVYRTTPCNTPEDRRFDQHPGGSLKSKFPTLIAMRVRLRSQQRTWVVHCVRVTSHSLVSIHVSRDWKNKSIHRNVENSSRVPSCGHANKGTTTATFACKI